VVVPFVAGSSDRIFVTFDIPYARQVDVLRAVWWLAPAVVFAITYSACRHLRETELRPLRRWTGTVVTRTDAGGFAEEDPAP
jgi:hypothetical protein